MLNEIPLHLLEVKRALPARTVSTITFYGGTVPLAYISERIITIIKENPWLTGFLKNSTHGISIFYPNSLPSDTEIQVKHLKIIQDPTLHENLGFSEFSTRYGSKLVKVGKLCLNKESEPLFGIIVIQISADKFAIICSMSHVLADGHTFYSIYGMLSQSIKPTALIRQPFKNFVELSHPMRRGDDLGAFLDLPSTIFHFIVTKLFQPRFRLHLYEIDQDWIAKEKNAAVQQDSSCNFVSTNDIICSWFYRLVRTDVAMMAANLRDRIPGLNKIYAGNYQIGIAYQPADYATPSLIRRSLQDSNNLGRVVSGPLPSAFETIFRGIRICLITNWSTFYMEVELPDSEQIMHSPIFNIDGSVPINDACVIFRPNKGKLAVFIGTRSCSDAEIRQQGILARPLCGNDDLNKPESRRRWPTIMRVCLVLLGVSSVLIAIAISRYYF